MIRAARTLVVCLLSAVLLVGLGAGPVAAAVELDQSQEVVDELLCIQPNVDSACYNGGAQTFTAGASGELIAVELFLARQAFTTTTRDLVVEIHATTPDGALLATSNPVPASTIPVDPDGAWILVTFPTPASLTAGQVYAIVIPVEPMSATSDPAWGWGKSAADEYGGGLAWGGSSLTGWASFANGSDLAFRTYVDTGEPPTCDLGAFAGGEIVDGGIEVAVGTELEVFGFDFGSSVEVTIELVPASGETIVATDTTDIFGNFGGVVVFEAADVGAWEIVAYPTADPDCIDVVDLTVVAAGVAPTPTPIPSAPTPTATRRPTLGGLPDTSVEEPSSSSSAILMLGAALIAGASVTAGGTSRVRRLIIRRG